MAQKRQPCACQPACLRLVGPADHLRCNMLYFFTCAACLPAADALNDVLATTVIW